MSDPVTNVEVEDVLSSIRRLLADSQAHEGAPKDASADVTPTGEAPSAAEKLVLSPEFRVTPPEPASDAPLVLETPLAPEPELVSPDATAAPPDSAELSLADRRARLEETIAELEAAVAETGSEWEPDGSEELETAQFVMPGVRALDLDAVEDATLSGEDTPVTEAQGREAEAEAHPAEPFEAEPAAAFDDDAEDLPFVAEMPEAAALSRELDEDGLSDLLLEESGLDEDALRLMVAEAVRAELQGVLGERITRNVRKLVRREIYRIIASEDLS